MPNDDKELWRTIGRIESELDDNNKILHDHKDWNIKLQDRLQNVPNEAEIILMVKENKSIKDMVVSVIEDKALTRKDMIKWVAAISVISEGLGESVFTFLGG